MKKIISILTSTILIATSTSQVIACKNNSSSTFDRFNLSTWGDKQKKIVSDSYLKSAKSFNPYDLNKKPTTKNWANWVICSGYYNGEFQQYLFPSSDAVFKAFELVANEEIWGLLFDIFDHNKKEISADNTTMLSKILENGIYLDVWGQNSKVDKISGEITIHIQGTI